MFCNWRRPRWIAAAAVLLGSISAVSAQTSGIPPSTFKPFPKNGTGGTTTGGTTGTPSGSTGGSVGSGGGTGRHSGFGRRSLLTPEQELAVLLDTLTTVDTLLNSGGVQVSSELEILFLLFMVYESKYQEAVQAAITGGTGTGSGTGGTPIPGLGGTGGTGGITIPGLGGTGAGGTGGAGGAGGTGGTSGTKTGG